MKVGIPSAPSDASWSVLAPEAIIIGGVQGEGRLEVSGRIQGNITLTGEVRIAQGGSVLGDIRADIISVEGTVRGDLTARVSIEIRGKGDVEGRIEGPRIGIETGAQVVGSIATSSARNIGDAGPLVAPKSPQPTETLRKEVARSDVATGKVAERFDALPTEARSDDSEPSDEGADDFDLEQAEWPEAVALDHGAFGPESLNSDSNGDGERAGKRRRKRRRNRRPAQEFAEAPREAERPAVPLPTPVSSLPPRIPTFQKGAHGRRRD